MLLTWTSIACCDWPGRHSNTEPRENLTALKFVNMAARPNFLPQHQAFFNELFNDSDSEGSEFEGFTEDDIVEGNEQADIDFDPEKWEDGDREVAPLQCTAQPGMTAEAQEKLPNDPKATDFFGLFVTDDDYETMATETNRYTYSFIVLF